MKVILIIILFFPFYSEANELAKIINKGLLYSIDNKISDTETEITEYKKNQTTASYWPSLDLTAKSRTVNRGDSIDYIRDEDEDSMFNVNLRYTILDLARDSDYEASEISVENAYLKNKIQKEKTIFNIINSYFNLWEKKKNKYYIKEYLDTINNLANKVKLRVNGGLSTESDYIRAKVTQDDARVRYENADKELNEARIRLSYLIGEKVDIINNYEKSLNLPAFISENEVFSISPVVKMLKKDIEIKEYGYQSSVRERLPKLYIQGTYKEHFKKTKSPDTQVYLQLTIPVFDGGLITNKSKEEAAQIRISEYKLQNAQRELKKNYGEIRSTIEKEFKLQNIYLDNTNNAKKNIKLYDAEFTLGTRPLSDLISAQRELLTANLSETSSIKNYYIALAGIYNLYGNTIQSLDFM
ncbi:TolC family protein [Salmonella enterica]|uniref:TolC family protein n=1 Tax=Salmonella enterica TaxID=28901 RepID=A0A5U3ISV9_SALER|nr:TolC family protein [Salmonella enterica]